MSAESTLEEKRARRRRRRKEQEEEVSIEEVDSEEERGLTAAKGRATPGRRRSQGTGRASAILRPFAGFIEYVQGVNSELKKVVWPNREETRRLTVIVLVVTIVSALALGLISFFFTELFLFGLNNPIILVGFFVLSVGFGVFITRRMSNTPTSPY